MAHIATSRRKVEWGDCDPADIVFYPNYFRWFDAAAHNLFSSAGLDWADIFTRFGVIGLPLVDAGARFVTPSTYGDELIIESQVSQFHSKVLVLTHQIINGGKLAVEGTEKRVWAGRHPEDEKRLQALPIPGEIRDLLS